MKALILHANHWRSVVESPSQRIGDCEPEAVRSSVEEMTECLVVFFQVEKNDTGKHAQLLCKEIKKISQKVGTNRLVVSGFAHLSHSRPDPEVAKSLFFQVVAICKTWSDYEVETSHFGHNKTLLLDIKGHQDAFKHRSF